MRIEPYLHFNGETTEALRFYEEALGAQVERVMRFSDSPEPVPEGELPPGLEDKVMHASILVKGMRIMLSDGGCAEGAEMRGFSLSLQYDSEEEARRAFEALAEGGTVQMPIAPTFWSPCFGMVNDRFGVSWMVTVEQEY